MNNSIIVIIIIIYIYVHVWLYVHAMFLMYIDDSGWW
jgi:hypothetical protein